MATEENMKSFQNGEIFYLGLQVSKKIGRIIAL